MKKKIIFTGISSIPDGILLLIQSENSKSQSEGKYVGVNTCVGLVTKPIHRGKQLDIWKNQKHSQAYVNLQTPEADKDCQDKGFTTPAAETKECLRCHVLGKDMDESQFESTFDKTGRSVRNLSRYGSEYQKTIMKDKDKQWQNGLVIHILKRKHSVHIVIIGKSYFQKDLIMMNIGKDSEHKKPTQ